MWKKAVTEMCWMQMNVLAEQEFVVINRINNTL